MNIQKLAVEFHINDMEDVTVLRNSYVAPDTFAVDGMKIPASDLYDKNEEIALKGGGILNSAQKLGSESEAELYIAAKKLGFIGYEVFIFKIRFISRRKSSGLEGMRHADIARIINAVAIIKKGMAAG